MVVVFDASAVMACLSPDEKPHAAWRELFARSELAAPAIWPTEIVNALLMAHRRGRMTEAEASDAFAALSQLRVDIEPPSMTVSALAVRELASDYDLTAYDAAYLELAARRGLPLATLDGALRKAAKRKKVKLL